jgi:hypothetical protein
MNSFEKQPTGADANGFDALGKMPAFEQRQTELAKQAEVDPAKLELFNKFADFFKKDSDVKRALTEIAPKEQDFYGGDGAIKYADKLYEGVRDINFDIKGIMRNFYPSEAIENRLKQIETDVVNAGANPQRLNAVYQKDFAAMSEDFNKGIRQEIVGYSAWCNPHSFDTNASSINEILHLIHSSIVNNEKILQSLPVLGTSKGNYTATTLYGTESSRNPVAEKIFDHFGVDNWSNMDIVSLPDRTLMMVRDRGHALTVDVEKDEEDGKYYVNYFVPKICNVDKVNMLPGVRKVTKKEGESQAREFTTGVFSVADEGDVANAVIKFIDMVPTDDDIEIPRY